MPLIRSDYDSWFNIINDTPMATHFYYMNNSSELLGKNGINLAPLAQSGVVLSLLYMPFINIDDLKVTLRQIPYDQEHYGTVKPDASSESDFEKDVNVFKLYQTKLNDKVLNNNIPIYKANQRSNKKSWRNEGKLFMFPYYYITINDYINTPLKILPNFLPQYSFNKFELKVSQPISTTGGYTLYIDNYKGDKNSGSNEGMLASAGLDLPTSSSQYAQFMATSKASFIAQNEISERNANVGSRIASQQMGANITSSMLNPMDWIGIAGTTVNALNQNSITEQQIKKDRQNYITSAQAQLDDLKRAPRSVNLTSSDILMSLDRNKRKLVCNRYHIQEYYLNRLCDYFTLYGYKQNKMMKINTKNRKYFNYVKTLDVNILAKGIEKTEMDEIKEIYNSGITFWHYFNVTRDLNGMYDYTMDNVEV